MSGPKGYYRVLPGYEVSTPSTREYCSERLSEVYTKLHEIGADSAEARASAILSGLQVHAPRACACARIRVGVRARVCA